MYEISCFDNVIDNYYRLERFYPDMIADDSS